MSRPTIKIHNATTDEVVEREMNDEEFAQFELDQKNWQKKEELRAKVEATEQLAKSQAEEKLAALGLTIDDLKALGLG